MSAARPLSRRPLRQPPDARGGASAFWNLLLGALGGAALAATATVAAVRSPAVQERLGIVRADAVPLAARGTGPDTPAEPACPQPAAAPGTAPPEMLFNRQRLWSVPP